MPVFHVVEYHAPDGDDAFSRLTDLKIVPTDAGQVLIGTTRSDGVLRSWDITDTGLTQKDTLALDGPLRAGGTGSVISLDEGLILTGGGADGALQTLRVSADGRLTVVATHDTLPAPFDGFQHGTAVTLPDGSHVVFGALAGTDGLARLHIAADGTLRDYAITPGGDTHPTVQITATAYVTLLGQDHVVYTSSIGNTLTMQEIDSDGTLGAAQTIDATDGLWISAPTALVTAEIGGNTYVILGAAGSNSLSVIEITAEGTMVMRDHVLDMLGTRFGGITSLQTVTADGKTYILAGGADDGVSVFMLLDGGLLVSRGFIADTVDIGLDNISAIAARPGADGLDVLVTSSREPGVTQLKFATGMPGITLTAAAAGSVMDGTQGDDVLQGHTGADDISGGDGADIIRDGAGSDRMAGGAGADVFILSADGSTDTITDFTPGEDVIDLSLWPMLRDISQLWMTLRPDGMQITYGDEILIVQSADGDPIDYRILTTDDLIGASRLPHALIPGYPGPATPTPDPDGPTPLPAPQDGVNTPLMPWQLLAADNLAMLRDSFDIGRPPGPGITGQAGNDTLAGTGGADIITAGSGQDRITAGAGDDTVFGRSGNDTLMGENGADTIIGGRGNDLLSGGNGQDLLDGGAGDDILNGGVGDDVLWGGAGADTFIFNGGTDLIADFELGVDRIVMDAAVWTGLTSPADLVFVYARAEGGQVLIDLGNGDQLIIGGVDDPAVLIDSIDLF